MAKKQLTQQKSGWDILRKTWRIISIGISALMTIIFVLFFLSILSAFAPVIEKGNIAVIPINGAITTTEETFTKGAKSSTIIELIEKAQENEDIKAIILEINSPGGTPVATDEIANAVKTANKTTIAVIRETGASGAYWIASAADKIYANRMSITGSIGVKASNLEFAGLIADYNVTYRRLVAGELKDAGTPFKKMTPEEEKLFQKLLDNLHTEFINAVAENRNLPAEKVRELATGFVYLGSEAKELGLVDELGGKKDAIKYLEQQLNITAEPTTYKEHLTFMDQLSMVTAEQFNNIGKGIGNALSNEAQPSFTW